MNRAILVVMCDFIVVSMLSMITGLSTLENPFGDDGAVVNTKTANVIIEQLRSERLLLADALKELEQAQKKFGHSQAREAAMKKIEVQMAKADMQLQLLQTKDFTNVDTTEKEIQKIDQANLSTRYQQAMQELNNIQNQNRLDTFRFGSTSGSGTSSGKFAGYTSSDDGSSSEEVKTIKDLLARREVDLEHTMNELTATEEKLAALDQEKNKLNAKINEFQNNIAGMEKELEIAKDKLIDKQREVVTTQRQIKVKEAEITEHKKQITSMRGILTKAVKDLSEAKKEVEIKTQEIADVRQSAIELKAELEKELAEAEKSLLHFKKSLESEVLVTYKDTMKQLKIVNEQKRMIMNYTNGGTYYLPVIKVDKKNVVISLFSILSGNSIDRIEFEDVTKLDYKLFDPNKEDSEALDVTGPIYVSRKDVRVALLEIPEPPEQTLHFVKVSDLRRRGFNNLYLFKFNQYGKDGGTLEGRCSMSMDKNDDYLYIRNDSRTQSSTVQAEVGDMVMSKEGGFIGVIVAVNKLDNGKSEAKCFVFPDNFELRNSAKLSLKKEPKSEFYTDFEILGNKVLDRIKKIEDK